MSDANAEPTDLGNQIPQAESAPSERVSKLHEKALAGLQGARKKATAVQVVVVENGKIAARATDDFVHEYPWVSIGMGAGFGVLVGLLINRD